MEKKPKDLVVSAKVSPKMHNQIDHLRDYFFPDSSVKASRSAIIRKLLDLGLRVFHPSLIRRAKEKDVKLDVALKLGLEQMGVDTLNIQDDEFESKMEEFEEIEQETTVDSTETNPLEIKEIIPLE